MRVHVAAREVCILTCWLDRYSAKNLLGRLLSAWASCAQRLCL